MKIDDLTEITGDFPVNPLNESAEALGLLGVVNEFIIECMNDDPDSIFHNYPEQTLKLMKHITKAGKILIEMQEPVFEASLTLTLSKLEDLHNA